MEDKLYKIIFCILKDMEGTLKKICRSKSVGKIIINKLNTLKELKANFTNINCSISNKIPTVTIYTQVMIYMEPICRPRLTMVKLTSINLTILYQNHLSNCNKLNLDPKFISKINWLKCKKIEKWQILINTIFNPSQLNNCIKNKTKVSSKNRRNYKK